MGYIYIYIYIYMYACRDFIQKKRTMQQICRLREDQGWPLLCSRLGMGAVYDGQAVCFLGQGLLYEMRYHPTSAIPSCMLCESGCCDVRVRATSSTETMNGSFTYAPKLREASHLLTLGSTLSWGVLSLSKSGCFRQHGAHTPV